MSPRSLLLTLALLIAVPAAALAAAPRASHKPAAAKAGAPARRSAGAPSAASRTLDAVHIEGEIPVPQVLFITERDQRRFADFQHRRYLESSARLGASTTFPSWILVNSTPLTPGKETRR